MKNIFVSLLLSIAIVSPVWADDIYFETNFDNGITSKFTLKDFDENPTAAGLSKIDFSGGSWTSSQIERNDRAAVSSAYTTYEYDVEDWLILPSINIKSAKAILAWDALSVHYDFREDYKVMISEGSLNSSDFVELYAVTGEEYMPVRHAVSLAAYEGKDVYIAFVHTGYNKFMLAIDNVKVGEWDNDYALINRTDVSAQGATEIDVCGSVRNLSCESTINPVLIVDGEEIPCYEQGQVYKPGEEVPFNFKLTTIEEGRQEYKIGVKNESGDLLWSVSDTIYCSAFPRTILVEELSGTWCNNCPDGTITMRKLEHRFRNRIVPVQARIQDVMSDPVYSESILYWSRNLPSIVYNRRASFTSQVAADDGNIYLAMRQPVTAEVIPAVSYTKEGQLLVESIARFSTDHDNTTDKYRLGYIITENVVNQDDVLYAQSNNCQMAGRREFYYLPSMVPGKMMFYHDVARGTDNAFNGVSHSLPAEVLTAGVEYHVCDTIDIPASVIDARNIAVSVVVIETDAKSVLNAARVHTNEIDWTAAVENALRGEAVNRVVVMQGQVVVMDLDEMASVKLYAIDGRCLDEATGRGQVAVATGNYTGVAVLALETEGNTTFRKIIIK